MSRLKKLLGVVGLVLVFFFGGSVFAGELIRTLNGHSKDVNSVAFSPDGTMIASGSYDKTIKLWDVQNGTILQTFKKGNKHGHSIKSIAFSQDGTMIAAGGFSQKLKLWSIEGGSIIYEYQDPVSPYSSVTSIESIAFSPDSTKIACIGSVGGTWKAKNGGLWLLDTKTKKIKTLSRKKGGYCVAFSPDGTMIASGSGSRINLWNTQNGTLLRTLKAHNRNVKSVAFSPDGTMIASASGDNTIKLWDVQNGTLLRTLKGKYRSLSGILSVAFSPDGTMIASGGSNRTINLWSTQNGTLLSTLKGHKGHVKSIAFSPDGMMIASGSKGGIIKLWDMNPYNESLANQIYKSIDKSNYIALYEFTKKFYNKFDIVQQAYSDIYKSVTRKNTVDSYTWYMNSITNSNSKSAKQKLIDLIKEENLKLYKSVVNENNILAYKWYTDKYFIIKGKKLAKKAIFELTGKEDTVAGYEWFILQYANSKEAKGAINNLYKLTFEKAEEINTVAAYNTFIFAYPYASQVKEANKLAYELEKEKYTDIGMVGFFGKDEKMNKQARKILIKTRQILDRNKNSLGSRIVVERMYNLVQNEFPDTDATLSFLESANVDKFKKEVSDDILNATKNTSRKDEESSQREFFLSVIYGAKDVFKSSFPDKTMVAFYNKSTESFKKYLAEEEKKIKPYIKIKEKEISDKKVKRANDIKEKTFNFEKQYQKALNEYKSELMQVRSAVVKSISDSTPLQATGNESGSESTNGKDSVNSNSSLISKQKDQKSAQSHKKISDQLTDSERQELEQLRAEKAKAARKKEVNSELVTQSQTGHSNGIQNIRADTHRDGSETYFARISQRDHYGARNQKLKDVGTILQQDRANYHKYQRRDREDTGDKHFDTRDNRNKIKRMLARGSTSQKTLDAIRYGTPLVKVKIYPEYIDVTLESGGGQTQQRQQKKNSNQPRQNKSKKSKCNTNGSIRGISSRGDGFVAVRKGPGTKYGMVGKIYRNGTRVKICDRKGKWKGIIYGDCISSSSRSGNGSCKAGWVYEKYIRIR